MADELRDKQDYTQSFQLLQLHKLPAVWKKSRYLYGALHPLRCALPVCSDENPPFSLGAGPCTGRSRRPWSGFGTRARSCGSTSEDESKKASGEQPKLFPRSMCRQTPKHVIASQCSHWRGNPFLQKALVFKGFRIRIATPVTSVTGSR